MTVNSLSHAFIRIDNYCSPIPLVSTLINLVNIALKCIVDSCCQKTEITNHYYRHLKDKSYFLCFLLLIPVLNTLVSFYIYIKDKRAQRLEQETQERFIKKCADLTNQLQAAHKNCAAVLTSFGKYTPPQKTIEEALSVLQGRRTSPNRDAILPQLVIVACYAGLKGAVETLIPQIPDINTVDTYGYTPLMYACASGNKELVAFLVAKGADKKVTTANGCNAVFAAIQGNNAEILQLMLENQNPNQTFRPTFKAGNLLFQQQITIPNSTPLMHAIRCNKTDAALYLIQRPDVQIDLQDAMDSPLTCSVKNLPVAKALVARGEGQFINGYHKEQGTALHNAVKNKALDVAMLFLTNGANPLLLDENGKSSLWLACEAGMHPVVSYTLQYCKVDLATILALIKICADHNHYGILNDLLDRIPAHDPSSKKLLSEVLYLLCGRSIKVSPDRNNAVAHLLNKGADVNKIQGEGSTCLHAACRSGDPFLMQLLLTQGANPNIPDRGGTVAIHSTDWSLSQVTQDQETFNQFFQFMKILLAKTKKEELEKVCLSRSKGTLLDRYSKCQHSFQKLKEEDGRIFTDPQWLKNYTDLVELIAQAMGKKLQLRIEREPWE
jgi:ankyrin repeat protein